MKLFKDSVYFKKAGFPSRNVHIFKIPEKVLCQIKLFRKTGGRKGDREKNRRLPGLSTLHKSAPFLFLPEQADIFYFLCYTVENIHRRQAYEYY